MALRSRLGLYGTVIRATLPPPVFVGKTPAGASVTNPKIKDSNSGTSSGTSVTVDTPAAISGDIILAIVGTFDLNVITPNEGGWTALAGNFTFWDFGQDEGRIYCWWRPAVDSEPASYQFNNGAAGDAMIGLLFSIEDADVVSPINADGDDDDQNTASINVPAVTTTVDDCLLFAVVGGWETNVFVPPAGYAEWYDISMSDLAMAAATKRAGVAGLYGPETYAAAISGPCGGRHIAIRVSGIEAVLPYVVVRDLSGAGTVIRKLDSAEDVERDLSGTATVVVPFDKAHLT